MKLVYFLVVSPASETVQVNESYNMDTGQVWTSLWSNLSYSSSSRAFQSFKAVGGQMLALCQPPTSFWNASLSPPYNIIENNTQHQISPCWQFIDNTLLSMKSSSPRLDDPDAIEILSELISQAGNQKMQKIKSPNRWWFGVFEHESWFSLFCCSDDPTEHDVDG